MLSMKMIVKKKMSAIVLSVVMCLSMGACGNVPEASETNSDPKGTNGNYITVEAVEGTISIPKSELSEKVTYINYDSDGTIIQLIAVIASDGSYRLSLNTCQSCSPSP